MCSGDRHKKAYFFCAIGKPPPSRMEKDSDRHKKSCLQTLFVSWHGFP